VLKHNSLFYGDNTVLKTAILFSDWTNKLNNSIYFPLFVEWRGRLFTNTGYFSYQQGELARSLLLFKDGSVLNDKGFETLKVYTANCYGLDKDSIINRLNWTNDNINKIIQLDKDFIFSADEPLLFLACCF
jgi:DNA-directed RNA polymerase